MLKRTITIPLIVAALALTYLGLCARARSNSDPITFNSQIVRLLQQRCQSCHHDGDIAPFPFVTYDQAKLFGEAMREATESGAMPPWKAVDDCAPLDGVTRLTVDERETLARWVDAGMPEGNAADLPPPLRFDDSWSLGEPDVVLQPDQEFQVNLGDDIYRCFSLPTDLRGDRFVSAIDVKPGVRSIVHHATVYLDANGESKPLDDADPLAGFECPNNVKFTKESPIFWWVPGRTTQFENDGSAWLVPRGAGLVLKIHYHVHHGSGGRDRSAVGLYFARKPVTKQLRALPIVNDVFTIPAGNPNYVVNQTAVLAGDAHVLGIAPHMQSLGQEMQVQAHRADGSTQCLVKVEDWDAHWQRLYRLKDPIAIAAGTVVNLTAHYNNSTSNPDNLNRPPIDIHPGEKTTDETCIAFVKYALDAENREPSSPQIALVSVDADGTMIVKGQGFSPGADILIDGVRVTDTLNHKKKSKAQRLLMSIGDWKRLAVPGKQVSISVLNTDGVSSVPASFVR
jgi:Copper type II ascorbate-dependent monooxygenase, C-terminal domain